MSEEKKYFLFDIDLFRHYVLEHCQGEESNRSKRYELISEILDLVEKESPYKGLFLEEDWATGNVLDASHPQQMDEFLAWEGWPGGQIEALESKIKTFKRYQKKKEQKGKYKSLQAFITEDREKFERLAKLNNLPKNIQDFSPFAFLINVNKKKPSGKWKDLYDYFRQRIETATAFVGEHVYVESLFHGTESPSRKPSQEKRSNDKLKELVNVGSSALMLMFAVVWFRNQDALVGTNETRLNPSLATISLPGPSLAVIAEINAIFDDLFSKAGYPELQLSQSGRSSRTVEARQAKSDQSHRVREDELVVDPIIEPSRKSRGLSAELFGSDLRTDAEASSRVAAIAGTSSILEPFNEGRSQSPNFVRSLSRTLEEKVSGQSSNTTQDGNGNLDTVISNPTTVPSNEPKEIGSNPSIPNTPIDTATPNTKSPSRPSNLPTTKSPVTIIASEVDTPETGNAVAVVEKEAVATPNADGDSDIAIDASTVAISKDGDAYTKIDAQATAVSTAGNANAEIDAQATAISERGNAFSEVDAEAIAITDRGNARSNIQSEAIALATEGDAAAVIEATANAVSKKGDAEATIKATSIATANRGNSLAIVDAEALAVTSEGDAKAVVEADAIAVGANGNLQAIIDVDASAQSTNGSAQVAVDVEALSESEDGTVHALVDIEAFAYSKGEGTRAVVSVDSSTTQNGPNYTSTNKVTARASGSGNANIKITSSSKGRNNTSLSSVSSGAKISATTTTSSKDELLGSSIDQTFFEGDPASDSLLFGGAVEEYRETSIIQSLYTSSGTSQTSFQSTIHMGQSSVASSNSFNEWTQADPFWATEDNIVSFGENIVSPQKPWLFT